jgi:hypothetical protein
MGTVDPVVGAPGQPPACQGWEHDSRPHDRSRHPDEERPAAAFLTGLCLQASAPVTARREREEGGRSAAARQGAPVLPAGAMRGRELCSVHI